MVLNKTKIPRLKFGLGRSVVRTLENSHKSEQNCLCLYSGNAN